MMQVHRLYQVVREHHKHPVLSMLYLGDFFVKLEWREQKGRTHEHLYLHPHFCPTAC